MNDRYLYRAKRVDTGEWVQGYLLNIAKINAFICTGKIKLDGTLKGIVAPEMYAVDQSTICQCAGLKDKNGKLIWENDIIELYDRYTDYRWRAVVRYGNPNHEYTWGWQLEPIGKCDVNTDILCWIEMEESGATCEVIGSAIDNLELLEVGE